MAGAICSNRRSRAALQAARRDLRLPAEIAKLDRFDLLVLDDVTHVKRDQAETSVLFELITERYERRSIALTANQPFAAWDGLFPDSAMTLAAVDRLVCHATILEMNVESYRRKREERRPRQTGERLAQLPVTPAKIIDARRPG